MTSIAITSGGHFQENFTDLVYSLPKLIICNHICVYIRVCLYMYKNTSCFFLWPHVSAIIHTNSFRKSEGGKKKKTKAHNKAFHTVHFIVVTVASSVKCIHREVSFLDVAAWSYWIFQCIWISLSEAAHSTSSGIHNQYKITKFLSVLSSDSITTK